MIDDLIKQFVHTSLANELVGKDPSSETKVILEKLADELHKKKWKCTPSEISNYSHAMVVFYEMTIKEIGGDIPGLLCYYYSTLVSKDTSLPLNSRLSGNMYRAFVLFMTLEKMERIISMSQSSPIGNYRGHLSEESIFDFLLLSDVYKAWDVDPANPTLAHLKRQAPNVAANYPTYTRAKVIEEGELAHESLFNFIKTILQIE